MYPNAYTAGSSLPVHLTRLSDGKNCKCSCCSYTACKTTEKQCEKNLANLVSHLNSGSTKQLPNLTFSYNRFNFQHLITHSLKSEHLTSLGLVFEILLAISEFLLVLFLLDVSK